MDERKMLDALEMFCKFDCCHKKVLVESPFEPTEVIVNGDVVYNDDDDPIEVYICDSCPAKDLIRYLSEYRD